MQYFEYTIHKEGKYLSTVIVHQIITSTNIVLNSGSLPGFHEKCNSITKYMKGFIWKYGKNFQLVLLLTDYFSRFIKTETRSINSSIKFYVKMSSYMSSYETKAFFLTSSDFEITEKLRLNKKRLDSSIVTWSLLAKVGNMFGYFGSVTNESMKVLH